MAKRKSAAKSTKRRLSDMELLQRAAAALPKPPLRNLKEIADDDARAAEIHSIDLVEQQAWLAWHRSCERDKPDARYLTHILRCATIRFNLLGIPPRPPKPKEPYESPEALNARLAALYDEICERGKKAELHPPARYE